MSLCNECGARKAGCLWPHARGSCGSSGVTQWPGCLHQAIARVIPTRWVSSLQPELSRGSCPTCLPPLSSASTLDVALVSPALEPGGQDHTPTTHADTVFPAKPSQALGVSQDKAGGLALRLEPDSGLNDGLSRSCSQSSLWELKQVPPPLLGELWSTLGRVGRKGVRQGPELGCKGRRAISSLGSLEQAQHTSRRAWHLPRLAR